MDGQQPAACVRTHTGILLASYMSNEPLDVGVVAYDTVYTHVSLEYTVDHTL